MSRRPKQDVCARCGAALDAPIHGTHPTRCHAFEPRRHKPAARGAKVVPIDPARFPRLVAAGELHVGGERVLLVGRLDQDDELVFVGEPPVADLLGGPGDEPYSVAHLEVVNEDGEIVQTFDFSETVEQLIAQAGRFEGPGRVLTPDDRRVARECRALLVHIFGAAIRGVIR